jgi:enoyl-CoA hydratase/carnithine racemase
VTATPTSRVSASRDGGILRLVLNRPDKLNAVDTPTLNELRGRLDAAAADDSVRVVLLTGAGRAFCSGGDLTGRDTAGAGSAANEVVLAVTGLPKPVVAGVHGPAVGFGCSLALACDLVIAARSAFFQLGFANVGLMTDGGTSTILAAVVGRARATRMAMLAERIPAATAFEWGMITHVVDDAAYDEALAAVVQALADGPTESYQWMKRALGAAALTTLTTVQSIELEGQSQLSRTAEFRRRSRAFHKGRR